MVLVSSDHSKSEWEMHFGQMSWLSVPYGDKRIEALQTRFDVKGVPMLVIVDAKTGVPITTKGRKDLKEDVEPILASWRKIFELIRAKAPKRAEEDAVAASQRRKLDWEEQQKKDAEEKAAAGITANVA